MKVIGGEGGDLGSNEEDKGLWGVEEVHGMGDEVVVSELQLEVREAAGE